MISKIQRVPRERITHILRKGGERMTKLFIARFNPNHEGISRYRVIVSKKIEPKAVPRNLLRRQIYEAIRLHEKQKEAQKDSLDFILIPKKNIKQATFQDIQNDFLTLSHGQI